MTAFTKENLQVESGYVYYYQPYADSYWEGRKFMARFKYAPGGASSFKNFLIKNFTVEEYFEQLDADVAPLKILEAKGYLLPHIKAWLKKAGYPVTKAGFDQCIQDGINKRKAA